MSCLANPNYEYPDYIKRMIKYVEISNDPELKSLLCRLHQPKDSCKNPILDEDGKALLFPFCMPDEDPNLGIFPPWENVATSKIGLSYKDAMHLYWTMTPLSIGFYATGSNQTEFETCSVLKSAASTRFDTNNGKNLTVKELLSGVARSAEVDGHDQSQPGWVCRQDRCFSPNSILSGAYGYPCFYFGVSFSIFFENYLDAGGDGSRAWIDKENQLIYPYIYAYQSLSGCCGNLGPDNSNIGEVQSGQILINLRNWPLTSTISVKSQIRINRIEVGRKSGKPPTVDFPFWS